MKKLQFREILGLTIFFLIALASLFVIQPAYKRTSSMLDSTVSDLRKIVEDKTGLSVSYNSMSLAIFSGLSVNGIKLKDVSTDGTILEIKRAVLHYNFFHLIFGDRKKALKDLVVDGVVFDFNSNENYSVFEKLFPKNTEKNASKNIDQVDSAKIDFSFLENIVSSIPFDVLVKNVHIQFSSATKILDVFMQRLNFNFAQTSSQILLQTFGSVLYSDEKSNSNYSVSFSVDGSIFEKLNGSLLNLHFSDFTDGNFRFNTFNFRVVYNNNAIEIRTMQNAYPFSISGKYDFDTSDVDISLKTQNLELKDLFYVKKRNSLLASLPQVAITMNTSLGYNVKQASLDYNSEGNLVFDEKIMNGGLALSYSLSGDKDAVAVQKLNVSGKNLNAAYSGQFEFAGFRLSGIANLYNYTLENGSIISTEIYFDPREKGFFGFAPQLLLDEKAFTALQVNVIPQSDSIDFNFELSDYSHLDAEEPGSVKIDGSFLTGTKYLQANLTSSGMYLDSIAQAGVFFTGQKDKSFAALEPFVFNGELYFSSDLDTFSYNVPYLIFANTQKDNQFIYLSLDGNRNTVQITQADAIFGKNMIQLSALVEQLEDTKELFFMSDLNYGSIPYHFTGRLLPEAVNISGDYGTELYFHKSGESRYDGSFSLQGFPLALGKTILSFSTDTAFSYSQLDGLKVTLSRLLVEEAGGRYNFSPHLELSGDVSKYGAFLKKIHYEDRFSSLDGKSELTWTINDGIFNSASFLFNMVSSKSSGEEINISADFSNPNAEPFSMDFVKHSMYMNAQGVFNKFSLDRFTSDTNNENEVTATVIAMGNLDNPYLGLNVEKLSFMTGGNLIEGALSAYVEEQNFTLEKTNLTYNKMKFSDIKANFNIPTFTGNVSAVFDTELELKTVHAPLNFSISDTVMKKGRFIPEEFVASFNIPEMSGTFFKEKFPFSFTVLYRPKTISFFSSNNFGITGVYEKDGNVKLNVGVDKVAKISANGSFGKALDISTSNLFVDCGKLFSNMNIDKFRLYRGQITGDVHIGGMQNDPDFTGQILAENADFSLPLLVPYHITVPKIDLELDHTQVNIGLTRGLIKNSASAFASATIYFDRWAIDHIEAKVNTPKNVFAPADLITPYIEVAGDASITLDIGFDFNYIDVSGDVFVKNAIAKTGTRELATGANAPKGKFQVRTDLNINLVQHCTFRFEPLLRAVFTPNSAFMFKFDSEESVMQIDGEVSLRSGDIAYLNRSFYLKNGTLRFNPNESTFNPMITLSAETREKDEDGNDVRLILNATNQYLLDFNPQISSIPAKSEAELNQLLGQVAIGDSNDISGFLLSAGDYALQSTVGRIVENKLRDFFNFDILSIRTSVLQNALKQTFATNTTTETEKKTMGIGNYLDNSTVYIGKYIGSTLYADALLHWSYDETRVNDSSTTQGLVFKPEIGFEMESPFANIRWNMAPDITALMDSRIAGSTSVTLSWKFSF